MVNQGSFCDSDGMPGFMQEDNDEDSMGNLDSRREVEDFPILVGCDGGFFVKEGVTPAHMEADPVGGDVMPRVLGEERVRHGALGAIPIVMSDADDSDHENEVLCEDEVAKIEKSMANPMAKAVFAINRGERAELIALRNKMHEMTAFMERNGLTMAMFVKESVLSKARFNVGTTDPHQFITGRDEFGLPIFKKGSNKVDVSSNRADNVGLEGILNNFEQLGEPSGNKDDAGKVLKDSETIKNDLGAYKVRSWSSILKTPHAPVNEVSFKYMSLLEGISLVSPPDEVLQKGIDKFKCCVVGKFTMATLPFRLVKESAFEAWGKMGLILVLQKDDRTYVFKFNSEKGKNDALTRGTWYFKNRPLVVTNWGGRVSTEPVTIVPMWVKFSNILDCYWIEEGLGSIASVIGVPLSADALTPQLEIFPFAKICVQYKLGEPLLSVIPIMDIDLSTGTKSEVQVKVAYLNKPLYFPNCKSLGHCVNACPSTTLTWRKKFGPINGNVRGEVPVDNTTIDPANDASIDLDAHTISCAD